MGIKPSEHDTLVNRLSEVFGEPKSVAAGVFMDTAATAALYSKAVALVIDYIFNNSKAKEVHHNLHPKDAKGDGEVISLIKQALRKWLRLHEYSLFFTFALTELQDLGHYWNEQVLGARPTDSPLENYG